MKNRLFWLLLIVASLASTACEAVSFKGTNAPGTSSTFTFTIDSAATNLSLVVSNDSTAYSYLFLTNGSVAPTTNEFGFASTLLGATNQINLEASDITNGEYSLLVYTPSTSTAQAFTVTLTTNRTDLRTTNYPVSEPMVFSVNGKLTNSGSGDWQYFQVNVPTNLLTGWRVVLSTPSTNVPHAYIRRNALPTASSYQYGGGGNSIQTLTIFSNAATVATYFIAVYMPATEGSNSEYTLGAELSSLNQLTWDPGATQPGTQVYTNYSTTGGDYYFAITTETTSDGVWRSALNVLAGQASLYLLQGSIPSGSDYTFASTRNNSNGFVLAQGPQFSPGQNWYYEVNATTNAVWNLVSGEAFVHQLPDLAADASSSTNVIMGAEGMAFFKTTISTNTLAWRLGLDGLTNDVYVKSTLAPLPYNTSTYDLVQAGQMLVVPTYLTVGSQYFVGVPGNPGLKFTLDSRQQLVTTIPFNDTNSFSVNNYGYVTFKVQVPVNQIAWQINVTPTSGDASVAVNLNAVPNEFVNLAFCEAPAGLEDSISLVPPTLTDGSFYVTVYGTPPYTCTLFEGNPLIETVNYVFSVTNDEPNRVGWKYYQVLNTNNEQVDSLGWELDLTNAPAGSEIAIRRNAVPGEWDYRNDPYDYYGYYSLGYSDLSSTVNFLQQPNHQADVWYIGVYSDTNALSNFVLTGRQLTGGPVGFDTANNVTNIVDQELNKWQYFTVTVPSNAFGWDLRLTNVTSGSPYLYVCRDELPSSNPAGSVNSYFESWPSGYQWNVNNDWTDEEADPNGQYEYGRVLALGIGNPLQPGTYYVGVINSGGSTPMSYSLASRGIGLGTTSGFSIPVVPLAFNNGVMSGTELARNAGYYSVVIPSNTPSWRVEVDTNIGDVALVVSETALPNSNPYNYPPYDTYGGFEMNKVGDEQYLMTPPNGQSNIVAGTYYLAVVSQGTNAVFNSVLGGGSSSYTVGSYGTLSISNMGTVDPTGATDLLVTNHLKAGQVGAYNFDVPSGTLSLEVFLTNTTGAPNMTMLMGSGLPSLADGYGNNGGQGASWNNPTLINIGNPVTTNYTLMVQAEQAGGDAGYTVRVHAIGPQPVAFDASSGNNTYTITNQAAGLWQYFAITVPSNAFGWDLRLTNVTYSNGQYPAMYVSRDVAPSSNPIGGVNSYYASWPSGYQWNVSGDWTDEETDPDGQYEGNWVLELGMGNPLQAGNYVVGVINNTTGTNLISYTLASRGIGLGTSSGFSIPVTPLAFNNGIVATAQLARNADYYSVVVPSNTPSWRVEVDTNVGDVALVISETALPNSNPYNYPPYDTYGGFEMNKVGDEQYLMTPISGQSNIVAGTYYLAVVSQGTNSLLSSGHLGGGSSSYTLGSYGSLSVSNIGTVDPTGATDLLVTNHLKSGQIAAYDFDVPTGALSLEIFLTNTTGDPNMTMLTGSRLPSVSDAYGNTGGQGYAWDNSTLINIANPAVTNYTLFVQAVQAGGDASYTVRVHAIGPQPVAFDANLGQNTYAIKNQPAGLWQYFAITVPSNAFGWDLRLTNVTYSNGQYPAMYVSRDVAPSFSPIGNVNSYYSSWPSGYQWYVNDDWTGLERDPDGQYENNWVLALGMGNPLQPGNYVVGVINNNTGTNLISYTLASRGIGLGTNSGFSIPVTPLAFNGGVFTNSSGLKPRQADYYSVVVPPNTPNWKVMLTNTSGETALVVGESALPNSNPYNYPPYDLYGGYEMDKPGNEQYLLLPTYSSSNYVFAGTYYLAVVGQGVNPNFSSGIIGSNTGFYSLESFGVEAVTNLGTVGSTDILAPAAIAGGANALYQFTIPSNTPAVEVRLDNVTASPYMTMQVSSNIVTPGYNYGYNGGIGAAWSSATLITLPNPTATNYSLTVQAGYNSTTGQYLDADFTVHIRDMPTPTLAFDPSLNTGALSNYASGTLLDGESAFYEIVVPATFKGQPVIGWTLTLSETLGTPEVRVRPGSIPDNNYYDGTSPFSTGEAIIVPTYLTPGVWYVEVRGTGSTDYTLTSAALELNRPAWTMQANGGTVTTPGLPPAGPLFADTGVDTNGNALPGDQGSDLAKGNFDYYEIIVPTNNTGVLRTRLDAISGNPNLYIRAGGAPTLSHGVNGIGGTLYDRSLTASGGSEYGNWVPLNGRYQYALTNGPWYLAVQAGGNSNVRYRLRMDTGTISNLSLGNGSFTNQSLTSGDWAYFSAFVPTNAPVDWQVTVSVQLGNVTMYVRDTSPPGQATAITDLRDWNYDDKNYGPYPNFTSPGTYTLTTPPLRTGVMYYLGLEATADSIFSINCVTNGGLINVTNTIPFDGGSVSGTVPGNGILQYLMPVPPAATRILFNATNSTALTFSLEQGTVAFPGGPAQWLSSAANVSFNQVLNTPNNWPWLSGYSYYLTITNTSVTPQNFSLNMSQPADLTPFYFTAPSSVTATAPNPRVQVTWSVSNLGPATASGGWYDRVWFSTDGVLDANSTDIGDFYFNQAVPAGGTYSQTNTVTLPMSASGNYTLFVQVDNYDSIYEASLNDKVSAPVSGTFNLTPPDLFPPSVTAPATVTTAQPNPTIQVAWTATNMGTGAATGGWYDRVWFSTNGVLDANSTDIGDFYFNQTVAVEGVYSQTNTVTLPISLGGSYPYTLFVQLNAYKSLYESDYANDTSAGVPGLLNLDLPPQIVTQPLAGQLVAPGASPSFDVTATGTPVLSYQWKFDGANLTGATNALLTLNNAQPANSGAYVVVITNAFGAVTSSVANLLVASPGTSCISPQSSMVGWWPGENNTDDVVGGNNGTLQNGATYEAGMVGTAFSFTGTTEAVSIPYASADNLSTMSAWTIEGWVNPTSFNNAGYPTIFAQGSWAASLGLNSGTGALESWINNGSQMVGTTPVPRGQWSHVALVYNGTNRTFYLNGAIVGVGTAPAMSAESDTSSIGNVIPNNNSAFNGGIDELTIYNRALTFDEIAEIYLAGSYGKCPGGPLTIEPGSAYPLSANGMYLMLKGAIGPSYTVQASTNLINWLLITNLSLTNSPYYFTDPSATNYKWRFYRAVSP